MACIGGHHLINASETRIQQAIEALRALDLDQLVVAYCTGFHGAVRLYNKLGSETVKGETCI